MIKECPVNIECRVYKTIQDIGSDDIVIGEIIETYAGTDFITHGEIDIEKVKPITFSWKGYYSTGNFIGKAWEIGKNYNKD
jgi:flavin reductase (DIM6/NTAB) family NADH-FMN oxidoreductase RutF